MPEVGELAFHVAGDIGGTGISRFRFTRQDAASITGTDCNAAAAAAKGMLSTLAAWFPNAITWTCVPQVNVYDSSTGLVSGPLVVSSLPAVVGGSAGTTFGAGLGARVNWKTSTLHGRRLMKGATFLVPFGTAAFSSAGAVSSTAVNSVTTAATAYLTAMTAAALYPVVWHRPPKGTTAGGQTGIIYAGVCSSVPAGLRSRRV